jgi:TolA-binding protein
MKTKLTAILLVTFSFIAYHALAQKPAISDVMQKEIMKNGTDAAITEYKRLKKAEADKYDFSESQLRDLGLAIFQMGRQMDGQKLLKLNVEQFPKSPDALYFLGFTEYKMGRNKEALATLKKSLALNKSHAATQDLIQAIENPTVYSGYEYVCAPCGCSQHDLKFKNPGACIQCNMKLVKAAEAKK